MSGSEGDRIRVKVERGLRLFCSCAVQREVFFPMKEWVKGSLMSGGCIILWGITNVWWMHNTVGDH